MHIAIINTLSVPAIGELKEVFSGSKMYSDILKIEKSSIIKGISFFNCLLKMIW